MVFKIVFKHACAREGRDLPLHAPIKYFLDIPAKLATLSRSPNPEVRLS
jgi:hypothetical protein